MPWRWPSALVAFVAAVRLRKNVSSGSAMVSARIATVSVQRVWPALNVVEPERALTSTPEVAAPVVFATLAGSDRAEAV